jgi:outer membrane lipoprotein-sorting protein
MSKKAVGVIGLLLVASLALAGCGDKVTAEEIVSKMQEVLETTKDAHALVAVSLNAQGIRIEATAEVWEKAPDMIRAEVLQSTEQSFVGTVVVSNGDRAWAYEPQRNVVTAGSLEDVEMPLPQEILTSLQDVIQAVLDVSDVTLVGEESITNREAYKLSVRSKEGAAIQIFPGGGTATLWVDKEQWFVLRATYEAGAFGQGEMEIQSFELNPGLADSLFEFQVPDGATVIEASSQEPVPLTLDEAKASASFRLLIPSYVPEGATLVGVFQASESFVFRYNHSPEVAFTVIQGPELTGPPPLGESKGISVRGVDATGITDDVGGNTFLYWVEDGVTTTVAGHISLEEALKVAEGLR